MTNFDLNQNVFVALRCYTYNSSVSNNFWEMMHSQRLMVLNTLNFSAHRGDPQFDVVTAITLRDFSQLRCLFWTQEKTNAWLHSVFKILKGGSCLYTLISPNA